MIQENRDGRKYTWVTERKIKTSGDIKKNNHIKDEEAKETEKCDLAGIL